MKETLKVINDNIEKDIYSAVRRSTATLKATLLSQISNSNNVGGISNAGTGIGMDANELRKMMISKVDKSELEHLQ